MSTMWKPGRLGHLDLFGKGLVAMCPKSPSRNCGRRSDHDPRKMAWNTKLWVVDWTDGRVEMEVVVWRTILLDETGSDVKWSAAEQWRMRLDVEERQMRNAEHDDVDEKSASCGVEGSGRERWVVCPDGRSGTWTGTNGRPGVSEIEHHAVEVVDHDVDVVEGVRDCVVVRDGGGGDASLGPEKRHVTEEVQRSGRVVDKDRKSPVDEQAQCVPVAGDGDGCSGGGAGIGGGGNDDGGSGAPVAGVVDGGVDVGG